MEKVAEELSKQGLIFYDPELADWVIAEEYLSGNVKAKLITASQVVNLPDWIANTIPRNIEALEKVQPLPCVPPATPDIKAACGLAMGVKEITEELLENTISVRLGTNWIGTKVVQQFIIYLLNVNPRQIDVHYERSINHWEIVSTSVADRSENNITVWGTKAMSAMEILRHALNLKEIKIYKLVDGDDIVDIESSEIARSKMEEISEKFKEWIWLDQERSIELTKIYNDKFNNLVDRKYDGSHLVLPDCNKNIELREHQKNGVWRILQSRSVLLPYKVGYGKTYTMQAGAMELRRLKLSNKPMLVALNSTVAQLAEDFRKLYPTAKLLVADKQSFSKEYREQFVSKIALNDWDCVIIAHSQFFTIKVSEENERKFISKELWAIEKAMEQHKCRGLEKALARRKRTLIDKINKTTESQRKDDCIEWEKLGVDALFIDESQFFKNLSYTTKMRNVAGLSNSNAQRSTDTFMKVRQTLENGGRVIFSTGTPVSNSVAELFTMQRYLDLDYLEKLGLDQFDAWASQFGETVTAPEITATGSFKTKTRFARFTNLPELMRLYSRFADFPTNKVVLPLPELQTVEVAAPASEDQTYFLEALAYRADQIQRRLVEPEEDNMLKVTSDGRKSSLEVRLVDPRASNYADSKVNQCAWNAWKIWKISKHDKSTQLIFCDFSTPHPERHNVYRYIKDLLIAMGIPKSEVTLIHDCKNDDDRSKLFEKVRAGQVRILLGSTEKLGTGVNVQNRLIAEHHLDAPWRPSDVEQRTGRTRRQGNKYRKVWSFRYVTEGNNKQAGFDAFLWQTLETKAKFIAQISNGNITSRTAEDVDEAVLSFAQVKAMASGNPIIMEKAKLDAEFNALKIQYKGYEQRQSQIYFQTNKSRERIEALPKLIRDIQKDIDAIDLDATVLINGEEVTDTYLITKALRQIIKPDLMLLKPVITIGEFTVKCFGIFENKLTLSRLNSYSFTNPNYDSMMYGLEYCIHDMLTQHEAKLAQAKLDLEALQQQVTKPFEHLEKMQSMKARIKEIDLMLQTVKEDDAIKSFATWSVCADYVAPEPEIVDEILRKDDRPEWVDQIINTLPELNNVIDFPIQKIMEKPHIVTESAFSGKFTSFVQGSLF